jgi:methylphosphotriester-DNA--protein-cysteine methyltransferase
VITSSSRSGSSPSLWNCKNDFNSAFLYLIANQQSLRYFRRGRDSRVSAFGTKDVIQQLCYRPCNRCEEDHHAEHQRCTDTSNCQSISHTHLQVREISMK